MVKSPSEVEKLGETGQVGRSHFALAYDIGGTKIAAAIVSENLRIEIKAKVAILNANSGDKLHAQIVSIGKDLIRKSGIKPNCLGVACAGPMNLKEGTISPLNLKGLKDFPVIKTLENDFSVPVALENDVKALALGEHLIGAAKSVPNFVALVVSTGIGGGIMLDGRLLSGRLGNAGHIGHIIVKPGGHLCSCGARGCVEAEASGSAIKKITGKDPKDATKAFRQRTGKFVGRAISDVANLLDLELALVGGSVALNFDRPFFEAAQKEARNCSKISFAKNLSIKRIGSLDSPLIGAASLAFRELL